MRQNLSIDWAILPTGLLFLGLISGCEGSPVDTKAAAGRYEYYSGGKGQGTTCFVLSNDGTYRLGDAKEPLSSISMSGATPTGKWEIVHGHKLFIGGSSLPIDRNSSFIRVTVNDDLGMYCKSPTHR
jgi:hypothetical protein